MSFKDNASRKKLLKIVVKNISDDDLINNSGFSVLLPC